MSDKLSAVQAHIAGVEGLESVVGAMRGIAAARSRDARQRIAGIRACADIVGAAISDVLLLDDSDPGRGRRDSPDRTQPCAGKRVEAGLTIVFCAEQGFVGAFNEHVIESASRRLERPPENIYFMIGERGLAPAARGGLKVIWSTSMAAHVDEIPALADRITQALYAQLGDARFSQVRMVHAVPTSADIHVIDDALLPLDFARFAKSKRSFAPLVTLPVSHLLKKLAEEYIYTQLCEAIMQSFAAENDARIHAMAAARSNVRTTLDRLTDEFRRLRQEEITAEIVELSAGSATARQN